MDQLQFLEQVADRYREEGYRVTIRPSDQDLPPFLAPCAPDLIARKNGENVVVGVQSSERLVPDANLQRLAGAVNAQAGWRFDLVVLNPQRWPGKVDPTATESSAERIRALCDQADQLVTLGLPESAFVLTWSAAEAALRSLARRENIALEWNEVGYVLNALYSEGLLAREDYDQLRESARQRNAIVHGLTLASLPREAPSYVLEVVRKLLKEGAIAPPSVNGPPS